MAGAGDFEPLIPVDEFGRVVIGDPVTPMPLRATTIGLVQSASLARDNSPFVSPADIARIALGAGSGYASGVIVGRTLGVLAGLNPQTQQTLQQTGAWAGVLKNVVPLAFPH
jgi:hypothetical protein